MRDLKCETCNERKAAAKVVIDGTSTYMCKECAYAVQEQHPTQARCEQCKSNPSRATLAVDGKPFTVCEACAKEKGAHLKSSKSSKKSKKKTGDGEASTGLSAGICSEQGRRPTMEDAEVIMINLREEFPDHAPEKSSFFGVFDGHGGRRAADFVAKTLPQKIVASEKFKNGDIAGAVADGYRNTDNELLRLCDNENWPDGATGVVGIICNDKLHTSCVGDSELVISVDGVAQLRSFKHKPTVPSERQRIQSAGGVVLFDRLGASMAVSRSFGDKIHKHPFNGAPADHMSAEPHIDTVDIATADFMIVACDGLWDHFKYQEAVDFVIKRKKKGLNPTEVAAALVSDALERGSNDNITAIVVYLK